MNNTNRMWQLFLLATFAVASCGDDSDSNSKSAADQVVVYVPAGAAGDGFEATVKVVDSAGFPAADELLSPVFDIGPSGTQFDVPVTIGIPIASTVAAGTPLEVRRLDDSGALAVLTDLEVVGGMALVRTEHFSRFALSKSDQERCHNIATGSSQLLPLNAEGEPVMTPATLLDQETAGAVGGGTFSLGSTWAPGACTVTVSGSFGPGLTGDGEMVVRSDTATSVPVPHNPDGSFTMQVDVGGGPVRSLEFSDPCVAASDNHSPQYILEIGSWDDVDLTTCASSNLCAAVTCTGTQWCQPSTGVCVDPLPGQGECELHPNSGTCGSTGAGKCVHGYCMVEVLMDGNTNGRDECVKEGLVCENYPLFVPPPAACLAFNPGAAVTSSASNWNRQSVHCDNGNTGLACEGKTNTCHDCPACTLGSGPSGCLQTGTDIFEHLYVNCVPAAL